MTHESRDVADAIQSLRVFLNAYGDSDVSVIQQAKQRILDLIDERNTLYRDKQRTSAA